MEKQTFETDELNYVDNSLNGKKIVSTPMPKAEIGIDTQETIFDNILQAGEKSDINYAEIQSFNNMAQTRDQVYELLDTMAEDVTISAALEIYAEDATEPNDQGRIVWCDSADEEVGKYITFLLDSLNIDKHIYEWAYSLCKYGDIYLRLYKESEFEDELYKDLNLNADDKSSLNEFLETKDNQQLNEDLIVKAFSVNDRFAHYVEKVPNPAEVFELTKFGKTYLYIESNASQFTTKSDFMTNEAFRYAFKKNDVNLYSPMNFVHGYLADSSNRIPEKVDIFLTENTVDDPDSEKLSYTVRRGKSILYDLFKIWREKMLLENSMLLNRLTKSSLVRVIDVEVGDMAKESIGPYLAKIKQMFEQKLSFDNNTSIREYTNPGPMENIIYNPTNNGHGVLSVQEVGGNPDSGKLDDIEYFKDKMYAGLKIPKQYLGDTDDPGGFNGGTSLSLTSSRYAKTIKRIQNALIQMFTDLINILLIDKGQQNYINKFTLKMQEPTTQEQRDRVDAKSNQINMINDILSIISGVVEDPKANLEVAKLMLSEVVSEPEILNIIQDQLDKMEEEAQAEEAANTDNDLDVFGGGGGSSTPYSPAGGDFDLDFADEGDGEEDLGADDELPTPEEAGGGIDFSDNTNFEEE